MLEKLPLLEKEAYSFKTLGGYFVSSDLQKRLQFLENNHLSFISTDLQKNSTIQEEKKSLHRQVELNHTDIEKILSLVEEYTINSYASSLSPLQLLITNFILQKHNQNYLLSLSLLKREFIATQEQNDAL